MVVMGQEMEMEQDVVKGMEQEMGMGWKWKWRWLWLGYVPLTNVRPISSMLLANSARSMLSSPMALLEFFVVRRLKTMRLLLA